MSGLSAANITAADLIGKKCGVVLSGTNIQTPVGTRHICSDVVAGSSANEIIIKDFMGAFDLPLTVNSDNTLSLNLDKTFAGKGKYSQYQNIKIAKRDLFDAAYVNIKGYTYYTENYDPSYGTINSSKAVTDSKYFDYGFTFDNNAADDGLVQGFCINFGDKPEDLLFDYYGLIDLNFFDKSATATQTLTDGTKSTYDVKVLVDLTNNSFRIDNLFNYGTMFVNTIDNNWYDCSYTSVNGTFDPLSKVLTIEPQEIGGDVCSTKKYGDVDMCNIYGYYIGTYSGYFETNYDVEANYHYIVSDVQEQTLYGVGGQFDVKSAPYHLHGTKDNHWVSNGGKTKTYVDISAKLDDAKYFSTSGQYLVNTSAIAIDGQAEVTHQLSVEPVKWGRR